MKYNKIIYKRTLGISIENEIQSKTNRKERKSYDATVSSIILF